MSGVKSPLDTVVNEICKLRGGTVSVISNKTGIHKSEVGKVLSMLVSEGFLREIRVSNRSCAYCPLSAFCTLKSSSTGCLDNDRGFTRVYTMTEKGIKLCKAFNQTS